jgi:hypothetical protein
VIKSYHHAANPGLFSACILWQLYLNHIWIRPTHNHVKRRMQSLSILLGGKVRMRAIVTSNFSTDLGQLDDII